MKVRRFYIPFSYNNKIISKSKYRIYRDVVLLTPGEFVDALSNDKAIIKANVLKNTALKWESRYLDIDHAVNKVLARIGYVEPRGWNGKAVIGDLFILPITQNARDTIALIDAGLITDVSVEIRTEEFWCEEKEGFEITDITYLGVGIVTKGACPDAKIR